MEEFNSMNQKSSYLLCLLSPDNSFIPAASVFMCFSTGRGSTDHKHLKRISAFFDFGSKPFSNFSAHINKAMSSRPKSSNLKINELLH